LRGNFGENSGELLVNLGSRVSFNLIN